MARKRVRLPFEASVKELRRHTEEHISSVFSCLESDFLVLPRGPGFVEYATFEAGYEALKQATRVSPRYRKRLFFPSRNRVPSSSLSCGACLGFHHRSGPILPVSALV